MTQSIFQLMFVKAFGRIPSRRPGYCDKKSRGSAAAMFLHVVHVFMLPEISVMFKKGGRPQCKMRKFIIPYWHRNA